MLSSIKRFLSKSRPVTRQPTEVDISLARLLEIEPLDFKYVHSSDLSVFTLKVWVTPIEQYTKCLEKAILAFQNDVPLYRQDFDRELRTLPISAFFLNSSGRFIDQVEAMTNFKQAAQTLLMFYKEHLNDNEISVTTEHNRRLLIPIIQNLFDILDRLSSIQWSR